MSDSMEQETKRLNDKLMVDAGENLKKLQKAKAMSKLAKDLGQDTKSADHLIEIAEKAMRDILGKAKVKK